MRYTLLALALLFTLSSCMYRMPAEDEFSTVPITNNPHVTKDKGNSLLPGMK
ncbi:MAG: hypothetical protein P4L16_00380 [Chlamydiales bacterium]|nr:hypothetical protein [Chlamydiales bacterium]